MVIVVGRGPRDGGMGFGLGYDGWEAGQAEGRWRLSIWVTCSLDTYPRFSCSLEYSRCYLRESDT